MSYNYQTIKSGDYSDEVIRDWLAFNNITELILDSEDIYIAGNYIFARCFTMDKQREAPKGFPVDQLGPYDYYPYELGKWDLRVRIEDVAESA